MYFTRPTLDALRVTFSEIFESAYEAQEVWWNKIATKVSSSTRSNLYGFALQQMRLREWIGPRLARNLSEHDFTIANKPYEGTIEASRWDVEDNNLGNITGMEIPDLASAKKKHPDELLAALFLMNSGDGPATFDGLTLFNASHPTYFGSTTYSNKITSNPLSGAGWSKARAQMSTIRGENGQFLRSKPDTLIVPPQLEDVARALQNSTTYVLPGSTVSDAVVVDNVWKGTIKEVIVIEELGGDPTSWYAMDASKPIKPFVYQLRQDGPFVSRDNEEDPKVFEQAKWTWGTFIRDAVGPTLPFLISKNLA